MKFIILYQLSEGLFDNVDNQSIISFITETHFIVSCDICYLTFILA